MKKLLAIGGVIVAIFVLIIILTNKSNEVKLKDNPYDKEDLETATIDLIGNKNYQNITLPAELETKITSGEPVMAYFFSPTCGYCIEMTPILMPIADELDVHINQYNTLEYPNQAVSYGIEGTPTLIYFKDGEEVDRMYGLPKEAKEDIRAFLEKHKAN